MSDQEDLPALGSEQHETFEILMMGYLDGELTEPDHEVFRAHLESCAQCSRELVHYRRLTDIASSVKLREPQDHELDRFWQVLYNRMERRSSWLFLVAGVVLVTSFIVAEVARTHLLAWWLKLGIGAIALGFLLLFINVLRARLKTMPYDRYREVQR